MQGPLRGASALHAMSHFLLITTLEGRHYHSHFRDWEVEAQGNVVTQLQQGGKVRAGSSAADSQARGVSRLRKLTQMMTL